MENITYDYFYNNDSEQYQFLQMPWLLIKDEQFKTLTSDAKILYSLLLNRTSLSKKNGWLDEQSRVYLIYTVDEIKDDLNCGREKAIKSMKELTKKGLVETIRRGLGKPNLIYVKNFATSLKYQPKPKKEFQRPIESQKSENQTSGSPKIRPLEVRKSDPSNTYSINTNLMYTESKSTSDAKTKQTFLNQEEENDMTNDFESFTANKIKENKKEPPISNTKPSTTKESPLFENPINLEVSKYDYNTYKKIIQDNIEYSHYLVHRQSEIDLINELIDCMLDVICTIGETIKIGKETKPRQMVISQYLKINSGDINHILDRYKEQNHKITHLHAYLKTMLYTVKQENGHYYTNAVRKDGMVY